MEWECGQFELFENSNRYNSFLETVITKDIILPTQEWKKHVLPHLYEIWYPQKLKLKK